MFALLSNWKQSGVVPTNSDICWSDLKLGWYSNTGLLFHFLLLHSFQPQLSLIYPIQKAAPSKLQTCYFTGYCCNAFILDYFDFSCGFVDHLSDTECRETTVQQPLIFLRRSSSYSRVMGLAGRELVYTKYVCRVWNWKQNVTRWEDGAG